MGDSEMSDYPNVTATWALSIESTSRTCQEQRDEVASICEEIFDAFDQFILPTQVGISRHQYPEGAKIPENARGDPEKRIDTTSIALESESGISLQEVLDTFHIESSASEYILQITFEDVCLQPIANNVDLEIGGSQNTDESRSKSGRLLDIEILHTPDIDDIAESDYIFTIFVTTYSDIWFDETNHQVEKDEFSEFFRQLEDSLPVIDVERWSEKIGTGGLKEIY